MSRLKIGGWAADHMAVMQPVRGYTSTPPLGQATLDRATLDQATLDRATLGQPALDQAMPETHDRAPRQPADGATAPPENATVPLGYTSNARAVPERSAVSGRISVFA